MKVKTLGQHLKQRGTAQPLPKWLHLCVGKAFAGVDQRKQTGMTKQDHTTIPTDDSHAQDEHQVEPAADTEGGEKKKKKGAKDREHIQQLEAEVAELKDKYLRLFAEFDNYKKRTVKEKLDLMRTAAQDTLTSLLPVLDDFDRAKKIADDPATPEHFSEGVVLVYQKLQSVLKAMGLNEMSSTGHVFDPEIHEAITEIPAPTDDLRGKVVDTIEKGYYLHDKIIRHAKVVIGR